VAVAFIVAHAGQPAGGGTSEALAALRAFRGEVHGCLPRRADALFELGDAVLTAGPAPSLPHLSLEPVFRRGWGMVYQGLAAGRVDADRLRCHQRGPGVPACREGRARRRGSGGGRLGLAVA
jgi:hypothetical protein